MYDHSAVNVVVVDDTLANRWVLTRILEEGGYVVMEGETAADAIRLSATRPDLIVLDVRLPDGSGFDLARGLKAHEETADIPLLLVSASFTSPNERARGLDAGADSYLTHPVDPPVLLATVRALLRGREAELALRESEARFRTMADAAPVMIWLADGEGNADWFSRSWLDFVGQTLELQLQQGWTSMIHPADLARVETSYRAHVHAREPFLIELRVRRHDGEYRWILNSGTPRINEAGEFGGYIGSCIDITDRKDGEIERERLLARERAAREEADAARLAAEHANDVKAQFLASMSHELRTPLNAIGGYVDLLVLGIRGPINDVQREDLDRIRKNQHHLLGLINNVLNFAKIEAGHVDYHIEETRLHDVLEGMYPLVAPQVRARGLTYDYVSCPPWIVVHADTEKVQQVLLNLLSNAIKFTEPGGNVRLECACSDTVASVRVVDTGLGIPPGKLEAIFQPFVQVDQNFTRQGQGTGLGLSISRELARAMGGDITVESVLGEGAVFTLSLPRAGAKSGNGAEGLVVPKQAAMADGSSQMD
ncbi:MAG TPA: ATP-binding protein [Gemmatimonadaceae bacterium]|nr:ATP-binding protein [Gemmatimonadaceae bacterium]